MRCITTPLVMFFHVRCQRYQNLFYEILNMGSYPHRGTASSEKRFRLNLRDSPDSLDPHEHAVA